MPYALEEEEEQEANKTFSLRATKRNSKEEEQERMDERGEESLHIAPKEVER